MPGLREVLEGRYEEIESVGPVEGSAEAPVAIVTEEVAGGDESAVGEARARDESGKFVTKPAVQDKLPPPAVSPAKPVASGQGAAAGAAPSGVVPVAAPAFKAPQSWKASERELAAKLPPEFRPLLDAAMRREKEFNTAIQEKAEAAKTASTFHDVVRPYEAQIRAAGQQPHQYVGTLLQTAHGLFYGPPGNRPDMLADLIVQAGVPPEALDKALVARMTGQRPAPQQPQGDPRVDQLFRQLDEAKKERSTAAAAEADRTAGTFAESHEFFDDVAEDVANILDAWKASGKKEVSEADLERAYGIACQMNEDVAQTLAGRKAALAAQNAQASTQRARAASSSIKSQPTAADAAQPAGRRAALEARYDEIEGG